MKKAITNLETGEIIDELEEGDCILRGRSKEKLQSLIQINKGKQYVKVYVDSFMKLPTDESLSPSDMSVMFTLIPYIRYETGLIAYDNGKYINQEGVVSLSGLSEKTALCSVEKLVKKKILAKVRTGKEVKFYANPYIFMRGKMVNKTLHSIFASSRFAKGE